MVAEPVARLDRRHRRRQETVEQVVDVAVAVMAEQGVAGLSLGEVARRMGIRPPSLYVYFDSKNALYDAIFARGSRELIATMEPLYAQADEATDLTGYFLEQAETFVRWSVEHPAYSQLMFWRPVPNYEPSADAYKPAVELLARARTLFVALRERGLFRADTEVGDALRTWTMLIAGVITQQLANAPHESFDEGTFTTQLPELVTMFLAHYGPPTTITNKRRNSHGNASRPDR
jgi:AcrR family transcriptional regulator